MSIWGFKIKILVLNVNNYQYFDINVKILVLNVNLGFQDQNLVFNVNNYQYFDINVKIFGFKFKMCQDLGFQVKIVQF